MNKPLSITIKLVIVTILAVIGIWYILIKPPVSEVENYKKQEMPKPYSRSSSNSFFKSKEDTDSGDLSIMGEGGRYDEVYIGRSEEPSKAEE